MSLAGHEGDWKSRGVLQHPPDPRSQLEGVARAKVQMQSKARALRKASNGRPVILAGDFNSWRGRPDDSPRKELAKRGWFDAYDRSSTYTRPWLDSFNGFRAKPVRAKVWGGHIDRIFIRSSMGSSDWAVVAKLKHGRYSGTKPSDHNLVRTTVLLPQ